MSELDVTEPDVVQHLEYPFDTRKGREKIEGLFDRHPEDFGDGFAFEFHIERLRIIPTPPTCFTLDIDIGEEVHLNLLHSTSFTRLTSSSAGIEAESSDTVASLLCFERAREHFSDVGEYTCVRSDVGMWSSSNRGLIDDNCLVSMFGSSNIFDLAYIDSMSGTQLICEIRSDRIHDERGFTGSRNSGYHREYSERDIDIDIFEIILSRTANFDVSGRFAIFFIERNLSRSREIESCFG